MSAPLVSYCIATYKRAALLRKTLDSILAQSVKTLEVVVSDNDPEGSAREVATACADERITYRKNEQNVGMVKNFNNALKHASGEYIVFITDDDPIVPDHLETLLQLRAEHPGRSAYFGVGTTCTTDPRLARMYNTPLGIKPVPATGAVRTFAPEDFVRALLAGGISRYLLWSCGMVEAPVARKFGMPDYGTPFLTDFAYVALVGGVNGCVLKDKVLGWQTVHAENFGRTNFSDITLAAVKVQALIKGQWPDNRAVSDAVDSFVKQWCAGHLSFLFRFCPTYAQRTEIYKVLGDISRQCRIDGLRMKFLARLLKAYSRDFRALFRRRPG